MSKKISNDDTFQSYLGKFIQLNVNGVIRKYYVSNIDADNFVTQAAVLKNYSIIGESSKQECDVCEDVCYRNIPVIKVMFQNEVDNVSENTPFINNYSSEIHEIILNGTSLGQINTTFQKENHNEIWFVPYNPSEVIVSTTYASSSNSSIYNTFLYGNIDSLVLSSFNPSLLKINDYNEISIQPISAWNPVKCDDSGCIFQPPLSSAFFLNPEITLDIHKIFPLTTNTSSISCQSYTMHNFSWFEGNGASDSFFLNDPQQPRFVNGGNSAFGGIENYIYVKNYLSAGCVFQPYSASFYYFNPCQLDSPAYYPLDPKYYYTYRTDENGEPTNIFDVRFAYGWPSNLSLFNVSPSSNPNLPLLRKYQFFSSPNLNDKLFIFVGSNTKNPNNFYLNKIYNSDYQTRSIILGYTDYANYNGFSNSSDSTLYNSKYANELFEGTFYALEDRTWEGGTVRFRQLSVYVDSSISTITQNISVGPLI